MDFGEQRLLPAVRKIKDLEKLLASSYTYIVLLDCHLGQVKPLVELARGHGKRLLLHADLIEGLKNDEFAADYLCRDVRPAGLISTRAGVVERTRRNGLLAVQRLFLLDTGALDKSYALLARTRPDFVEVLPGVVPHLIAEVRATTGIPVLAGGLIRTGTEVEQALAAGATAVTTSGIALWKQYESLG